MSVSLDIIDPNLKILIEAQGSKVSCVKSISSISTNALNKGVFKITFEDNTVIKGRTYTNEFHAKKVYDLSKYLANLNVSKPLAILGNSMLLEWINDYSRYQAGFTLDHIATCGKIMAHVHSTPVDSASKEKYKFFALNDKGGNQEMNKFILTQIDQLKSLDMLTGSEADKLKEIICSNDINEIKLSLVCGDMCAENLVISNNNNIFIVDTENLTIDTVEYDLARSLFRWPMNKNERTAFMKGYISVLENFNFADSFIYWVIRVLVKSAVFRSKIPGIDLSYKTLPVKSLKMIIDHDRNSFPDFIDFELVRN